MRLGGLGGIDARVSVYFQHSYKKDDGSGGWDDTSLETKGRQTHVCFLA